MWSLAHRPSLKKTDLKTTMSLPELCCHGNKYGLQKIVPIQWPKHFPAYLYQRAVSYQGMQPARRVHVDAFAGMTMEDSRQGGASQRAKPWVTEALEKKWLCSSCLARFENSYGPVMAICPSYCYFQAKSAYCSYQVYNYTSLAQGTKHWPNTQSYTAFWDVGLTWIQ